MLPLSRATRSLHQIIGASYRSSVLRNSKSFSPPISRIMHFSTEAEQKKKLSLKEKINGVWKKYGILGIGTYLTLYGCTLGSIFVSLEYDVFQAATFGFDPITGIQKLCDVFEYATGSTALPAYLRENPTVGTLAVAWLMTKVTEPFRLAATIAILPKLEPIFRRNKKQESLN